jgi:hypothetical protein
VILCSDILGFEPHPKKPLIVVLYCFVKKKGILRERVVHLLTCKDEQHKALVMKNLSASIYKHGLEGSALNFFHFIFSLLNQHLTNCSHFLVCENAETPKKRKIMILINPAGGKGAAKEIWKGVSVMFSIAGVETSIIGKHFVCLLLRNFLSHTTQLRRTWATPRRLVRLSIPRAGTDW